jgi:hypothetical protein
MRLGRTTLSTFGTGRLGPLLHSRTSSHAAENRENGPNCPDYYAVLDVRMVEAEGMSRFITGHPYNGSAEG